VKSPEQLLMRSPDPINWTVPLDTGKTFSVTQSVRDNDSARNSPMSDHSSHFDSVSGTAINLGGQHTVNEKGALQHHKVSALAREAKEMQGLSGANKKEEKNEKTNPVPEGAPPKSSDTVNGSSKEDVQDSVNGSREVNVTNGLPENKKKESSSTNGDSKAEEDTIRQIDSPTAVAPPAHPAKVPVPNAPVVAASKVPGSNLKCLDDPNFSFDSPLSPSLVAEKPSMKPPVPLSEPSKPVNEPKKPSYRVLEDPDDLGPITKSSPYKVLEDPMTASFYQQEPLGQSGTSGGGKSRPE